MPRRRDVGLSMAVLDYVKRRICVLTNDVASAFGISDDKAYHTLQELQVRGEVCIVRHGAFNIWCARDAEGGDIDPFITAVPCLSKVRDLLRQVAESARGRMVSIAPRRIAKALAEECRMPTQSFLLTAAVYSYIEYLLGTKIKGKHIISKEELLNLTSSKPPRSPPCVNRRRAAGRTNGVVTVTFKLSRGVLGEVDRLAERLGVRRSDVIRRAIEAYLRAPDCDRQPTARVEDESDFPVIQGRT